MSSSQVTIYAYFNHTYFFQAVECYLANVIPSNSTEWTFEDGLVLQELVMHQNEVTVLPTFLERPSLLSLPGRIF